MERKEGKGRKERKGKEGKGWEGTERIGKEGMEGKGWKERKGMERTAASKWCGELRGRLRTAWMQRSGWKWVGRRAAGDDGPGCADGCGRQMGAENCADGCGRRGCNGVAEMGGEEKPLVMSDLGCADGCGRQMGVENCVDGCGRRGCNGVG